MGTLFFRISIKIEEQKMLCWNLLFNDVDNSIRKKQSNSYDAMLLYRLLWNMFQIGIDIQLESHVYLIWMQSNKQV